MINDEMVGKWIKSKAGTWHKYGGTQDGKPVAMCASYNLDRPNYLSGTAVKLEQIPENQKKCKKCLTH